ncbi:MAG: Arc family DNA-binding protein [Chloroflexota bacterium]|nr:Arc family DNA-binding protein [Anaerolineales bacterium]MCA9974277.1 Arc family DNA-binding protein [Anaerolineales bacterium]MCB8966938.1 Arc family DNA-binding protein [Ardenticatenaceae bacterium]
MATITIKNIPDELYARIKAQAAANRRSINNEIIVCLETAVHRERVNAEEFLKEVRVLRENLQMPYLLTDEEINAAKNEGRP